MNSKYEQMWENLSDSDFRKQFINEHVDVGIAFQIRSLRNRQELFQSDLAKLLGVKQPLVSSWENPDYGRYTLRTLKDLANAFNVGLLVRFVPFSKLVDWTVDLTSDVIAPPSFDEEQNQLHASTAVTSYLAEVTNDFDPYSLSFSVPKMPDQRAIASTATVNTNRELTNVT